MKVHKLVLHPADPLSEPRPVSVIRQCLDEIGLIDGSIKLGKASRYAAGKEFLGLITFLGCSPAIELHPPADPVLRDEAVRSGTLCHVYLSEIYPHPVLLANPGVIPCCPQCRRRMSDWERHLKQWLENRDATQWRCQFCDYQGSIYSSGFRHKAGFGRSFIEIWSIHPAEAVPGDLLMDALSAATGTTWDYFYIRN